MPRIPLITLALLLIVGGCASAPGINWDSRIGNYTYDLALQDLGVPQKTAQGANGTQVADWIVKPGTPGVAPIQRVPPDEPPGYRFSPFPNGTPPTPDRHLRLTFGPDGKLTAWEKYSSYPQ